MSQQLTLEISDEIYTNLKREAEIAGVSTAELVMAMISRMNEALYHTTTAVEKPKSTRKRSLKDFAGAIDATAGSADNEGIDADLVRAYANEY